MIRDPTNRKAPTRLARNVLCAYSVSRRSPARRRDGVVLHPVPRRSMRRRWWSHDVSITQAGVVARLALFTMLAACADEDSHATERVLGGGPLVYQNYDLRPISRDGLVAAAVVGFETVEVLRLSAEPRLMPVASPPSSAECKRMPIAVVPGSFTGAATHDLWVQEPCGGNWITTGPAYTEAFPSVDILRSDPGPRPYVDYYDATSGPVVVGGTIDSFYLTTRAAEAWTDAVWFNVPRPLTVRVTDVWAPIDLTQPTLARNRLLVQGNEELYVVTLGSPMVERTLKQEIVPPYVRPFAAYDHLTVIDRGGCRGTALGVGLFASSGAQSPRRLQLFQLDSDSFVVAEPVIHLDDVTTFNLQVLDDGSTVLGVLGTRSGRETFTLHSLDECSDLTTLAELEVSFDLKTPPLPADYEGDAIPLTSVSLVSYIEDGMLRFGHYDGFSVRLIEATLSATGWSLEERHHEVHAQRSDSSFD